MVIGQFLLGFSLPALEKFRLTRDALREHPLRDRGQGWLDAWAPFKKAQRSSAGDRLTEPEICENKPTVAGLFDKPRARAFFHHADDGRCANDRTTGEQVGRRAIEAKRLHEAGGPFILMASHPGTGMDGDIAAEVQRRVR